MSEEKILEEANKLYEDTQYIFRLKVMELNIMITGLLDMYNEQVEKNKDLQEELERETYKGYRANIKK